MTTIINVADLPAPDAITPLDHAAIMARGRADFVADWNEVRAANPDLGLPVYSVEMLETDPLTVTDRAFARRELLLVGRTNDSVRAVMPAWSRGKDLENLVARADVVRLPTAVDGDGVPTAWENDAQLLDRYLRAYARPAAGSEDGYIYQVATAWPQRHDIKVYNYATEALHINPGALVIYLLGADGDEVSDETVALAVKAVGPKTNRPLTDVVSVRKATIARWSISAKLTLPRGASPAAVVAGREAALRAFADRRYHIEGLVTDAGAVSALWDPNVIDVTDAVVTGLQHGPGIAPFLDAINLTYEVQV